MRVSLLCLCLLLLGGCGDGSERRTRSFESDTGERATWRGTYATSPHRLKELEGRGTVTLRFLRDGRAEFEAIDFAFPELVIVGRARTAPKDRMTLEMQCERSVIFRKDEGVVDARAMLWSRTRGQDEKVSADTAVVARLDKLRAESKVLATAFPHVLTTCASKTVQLSRKVLPGGYLELTVTDPETLPISFTDVSAKSFVSVVDALPRPAAEFPVFAKAQLVPSLQGAVVVADPRNVFVPSPHAHRYYLLPSLRLKGAAIGTVAVRYTRGTRPNFKKIRVPDLDPHSYFEIELARWEPLEPKRWRRSSGAFGEHGVLPPLAEKDGEITFDVGQSGFAGAGAGRLEIGYELPHTPGEILWQTISPASEPTTTLRVEAAAP